MASIVFQFNGSAEGALQYNGAEQSWPDPSHSIDLTQV